MEEFDKGLEDPMERNATSIEEIHKRHVAVVSTDRKKFRKSVHFVNIYIFYKCIYCYLYHCYLCFPPLHFYIFSRGKRKTASSVANPSSGFHSAQNGIIRQIDTTKEKHGIFCQNDAHLGSYNNVSVNELQCQPFTEYGAPIKSTNDVWSIPPLSPPSTTVPVLLLVLVSRSHLELA